MVNGIMEKYVMLALFANSSKLWCGVSKWASEWMSISQAHNGMMKIGVGEKEKEMEEHVHHLKELYKLEWFWYYDGINKPSKNRSILSTRCHKAEMKAHQNPKY